MQNFDYIVEYQLPNIICNDNLIEEKVNKCKDIKYYDNSNNLILYIVFDKDNDKLTHINYFHNKKIYKRDKYHYNGYLSSTQNIDSSTNRVLNEVFYNKDAKIVISKFYEYKNNINKLIQLHLHDLNGNIKHIFFNEQDLFTYALNLFIKSINNNNIFIISDKSKLLYSSALYVKDTFLNKNISIMPVIHSTHTMSNDIDNGAIKSHYKDIFNNLNKTDSINVFSTLQKDDILKRFNYNKLSIIAHTYFKINNTMDYKPKKNKVIYVARFSPEKNHLGAVRIFKIVVQSIKNATLHFYGSGAEKENIRSLIYDLKLENNIFLHNYSDNIEGLLCSSELSILTSSMEGFPLCLLESIACSCPVISYDVRYGPSEIISNNKNGFLIPHGNENMFADKIIEILSNQNLQKKMSLNARSSFEKRFSPQVIAMLWKDKIKKFYT